MRRSLSILFLLLITGLHTVCNRAAAATLSGTVMMTYSNKPYVGPVLIRPLSTPLTINGNLVTGGDFKAITDGNGILSVALQAGNYRVTIGADKGFTIDVPNDSNTYTWIERIITALTWNSAIIPSTNTSSANIISYTNVAEMIAATVPTATGNIVSTLGRLTPNDGGGGLFWFDSTSSSSTNLGTIFAPATGTGRWKRLIQGSTVNVRWFGAKGDGTTTDSTAFQSALDWRDSSGRPGTVYVPASTGTYRVSGLVGTGGRFKGDGNVERGTDVATKTASVLEHVTGATSDLLTVNAQNAGGGPSMIIEDLLFLGHPESNLRDPQTITAVYSGDRLHFDVATAPSIEGAKGSHPYLGFGALFTDENRYLGTFMLQSFITNGSGSTATNTVNIAIGTDAYATVTGESILRTGFKACFPKSTTWYSGGSSMGARSFSHMAGYSAIVLWDSDESTIRNCKFVNWHSGVVVDSPSVVVDGMETYNCHLSGLIAEPFGFLADSTVYGFVLLNGRYQLDDALVPASYTLKNTMYRYSAIGLGLLGAQAKIDNVVAGPTALYGGFFYGGTHSHINNLLIESPAGVPLYFPLGNSTSPQAFTSISRLRVLSGYASETIPDNRRNDLAIVEVNTSAARVAIAQASVAPFTSSGTSTNWTWAFWYKWPNTSTDTLVGIGQYEDVNQMVPRGSQKPGGAYNAQRWQMMGGVQMVGGAATEPIVTFSRDVAEPNANKVGITYSGGAKLLYAHNGDGIVNDVGYTLESNTSATQLTLGDLSGVSAPRTGIIQGEPGSGTDISGGSTHLRSGTGTGAGPNSAIYFYTPAVGSTGVSPQTQTLRMTLGQGGQLTFTGLTADPTVGTATGSLYYNSASNSFRWHNGTSWANLGSGGGGGSGDVVGPASATDNAVVRFDGTTGKLVQDSAVTIADTTGDITAGKFNKVTVTAPATGSTLTIADGKTLTANNSITLAGTDSTTMTFPGTSASIARTDAAQTFSGLQTFSGNAELRNGTSANAFDVYNTYTSGSNYERVRFDFGTTFANEVFLGTQVGASGTHRNFNIIGGSVLWMQSGTTMTLQSGSTIQFRSNGSNNRWLLQAAGSFVPNSPNAVDLGGTGNEVRSLYLATSAVLSSAATIGWNGDAFLLRNGANNVAQRNGTTAQRFDVFNTYTDATTYENGSLWWTGNTLVVGTDKGSVGGSVRALQFMVGGASKWQVDTAGILVPITDDSVDFGKSTARIKAAYVARTISIGAGGTDVILSAESAGVMQLGNDGATPTAYTIKSADGSGTDKDGGKLTRAGGKSTGTGRGGDLVDMTSLSTNSTSTANSYSTRAYQSAKPVDLTSATATQLFTVTVGAGNIIGMSVHAVVYAGDGTDIQSLESELKINTGNKAGTIGTTGITQTDCGTPYNSAGTLTPVTYTLVDNGSGVLAVKCNATSSLSETYLRCKWQIVSLNSDGVATVTPN